MDNDFQSFPTFQWSFFPNGRDGEQVVVRGNDFTQFLLDIEACGKEFMPTRLKPTDSVPAEEPTARKKVCPTCGSEVISGATKNGKKFEKCSTNKWDREAQQAVGCSYIKWLND